MQEGGYMTSIWKDLPPSPVSREGTIHDGEIYRRWAWVEPSIMDGTYVDDSRIGSERRTLVQLMG